MKYCKKSHAGFTLIELMVTLSIAAVLMMVAAPSMVAFKRNSELSSLSNTLLSAINAARGEAMKRGMAAYVVPSNGGGAWEVGWVVFVDKNNNQIYDDATDQLIYQQAAPASYFTITGNGPAGVNPAYIRFDPSGYPKLKNNSSVSNLTFTISRNDVTGTTLYENTRRLKIDKIGRVRICKPTSATDTKCPAPS